MSHWGFEPQPAQNTVSYGKETWKSEIPAGRRDAKVGIKRGRKNSEKIKKKLRELWVIASITRGKRGHGLRFLGKGSGGRKNNKKKNPALGGEV